MQDPYTYPGTNTLINKHGIRDPQKLQDLEAAIHRLKLSEPLPKGNLDYSHLRAIHKHFFEELYDWAGKERTIDISKGDSRFCHHGYISREINKLFDNLKKENFLKGMELDKFCERLSLYFNEINAAHPFREGNGRTQRAFCNLVAAGAGYQLDWDKVNPTAYLKASIEGFSQANYEPMKEIFKQISAPKSTQISQLQNENKIEKSKSNEVDRVIAHFATLDRAAKEAENQPYAYKRAQAKEAIEKYAVQVQRNKNLVKLIEKESPELTLRLNTLVKEKAMER